MSTKTCTGSVRKTGSDARYKAALSDIKERLASETDLIKRGDLRCLQWTLEYGLRTGQVWPGMGKRKRRSF